MSTPGPGGQLPSQYMNQQLGGGGTPGATPTQGEYSTPGFTPAGGVSDTSGPAPEIATYDNPEDIITGTEQGLGAYLSSELITAPATGAGGYYLDRISRGEGAAGQYLNDFTEFRKAQHAYNGGEWAEGGKFRSAFSEQNQQTFNDFRKYQDLSGAKGINPNQLDDFADFKDYQNATGGKGVGAAQVDDFADFKDYQKATGSQGMGKSQIDDFSNFKDYQNATGGKGVGAAQVDDFSDFKNYADGKLGQTDALEKINATSSIDSTSAIDDLHKFREQDVAKLADGADTKNFGFGKEHFLRDNNNNLWDPRTREHIGTVDSSGNKVSLIDGKSGVDGKGMRTDLADFNLDKKTGKFLDSNGKELGNQAKQARNFTQSGSESRLKGTLNSATKNSAKSGAKSGAKGGAKTAAAKTASNAAKGGSNAAKAAKGSANAAKAAKSGTTAAKAAGNTAKAAGTAATTTTGKAAVGGLTKTGGKNLGKVTLAKRTGNLAKAAIPRGIRKAAKTAGINTAKTLGKLAIGAGSLLAFPVGTAVGVVMLASTVYDVAQFVLGFWGTDVWHIGHTYGYDSVPNGGLHYLIAWQNAWENGDEGAQEAVAEDPWTAEQDTLLHTTNLASFNVDEVRVPHREDCNDPIMDIFTDVTILDSMNKHAQKIGDIEIALNRILSKYSADPSVQKYMQLRPEMANAIKDSVISGTATWLNNLSTNTVSSMNALYTEWANTVVDSKQLIVDAEGGWMPWDWHERDGEKLNYNKEPISAADKEAMAEAINEGMRELDNHVAALSSAVGTGGTGQQSGAPSTGDQGAPSNPPTFTPVPPGPGISPPRNNTPSPGGDRGRSDSGRDKGTPGVKPQNPITQKPPQTKPDMVKPPQQAQQPQPMKPSTNPFAPPSSNQNSPFGRPNQMPDILGSKPGQQSTLDSKLGDLGKKMDTSMNQFKDDMKKKEDEAKREAEKKQNEAKREAEKKEAEKKEAAKKEAEKKKQDAANKQAEKLKNNTKQAQTGPGKAPTNPEAKPGEKTDKPGEKIGEKKQATAGTPGKPGKPGGDDPHGGGNGKGDNKGKPEDPADPNNPADNPEGNEDGNGDLPKDPKADATTTELKRGNQTFDLKEPKYVAVAEKINPEDGGTATPIREALKQQGFTVPEDTGAPVGKPISPSEIAPGDVVSSNGQEGLYLGDKKVLTGNGVLNLSDMADFSDPKDGIFRLDGGVNPGGEDGAAINPMDVPETPDNNDHLTRGTDTTGGATIASEDTTGGKDIPLRQSPGSGATPGGAGGMNPGMGGMGGMSPHTGAGGGGNIPGKKPPMGDAIGGASGSSSDGEHKSSGTPSWQKPAESGKRPGIISGD